MDLDDALKEEQAALESQAASRAMRERLAAASRAEAVYNAEMRAPESALCCDTARRRLYVSYGEWQVDSADYVPVVFCPYCGTKLPELDESA